MPAAALPQAFDEAFDAAGRLREPYASLRRRTGWNPLQPTRGMAERLRTRPLSDDTRIFPVPIVLDDDEYRLVIGPGVAQRARALRELFSDLVLGSQRILAAGIGLTGDQLHRILATEGLTLAGLRQTWTGRLADDIRFVYGPDLVRGADGRWVVIEDNVGCVGGSADAHFVSAAYRRASSLDGAISGSVPDLLVAAQRWIQALGRDLGTVVAVLGCEVSDSPADLRIDENSRRRHILSEAGIPVLSRTHLRPSDMTQSTVNASIAEGLTVLNFDTDDTWVDLLQTPAVALLNAPGTSFLGNKALLPNVAEIIRFYTGEDPILPTPPTVVLENPELPRGSDWVLKAAAGRQGTEVFMLDALSPDQCRRLIAWTQEKGPAGAVAQRFVEPSRLRPAGSDGWEEYQVELRPVTYVLGEAEIHVSDQPLGKVISIYDARRLNNISRGAYYAAVLREPLR